MRTRLVLATTLAVMLLGTGFSVAWAVAPQSSQPASAVRGVTLPLEFPGIGNVDAVRNWHFARIEGVELVGNEPDVTLKLRDAQGAVVDVIAPRAPLRELAFASGWVRTESKSAVTRNDYAERMVAVDVDSAGRLIAIVSLEPIDRDRNKLRRAIGG